MFSVILYILIQKLFLIKNMNSNINDTTLNTVIPIQIPLTKPTRFLFIKENYGHDSYKLYQYYEKLLLNLYDS